MNEDFDDLDAIDFKKLKDKNKGKKKIEKEQMETKKKLEEEIKEKNEKRYKELLRRVCDTLTKNNPDLGTHPIIPSRKYQNYAEASRGD